MKFIKDEENTYPLRLIIKLRIRNSGTINRVYNTGIQLPNYKAFNFNSHTIDEMYYEDGEAFIHQQRLEQIITSYRKNIDLLKNNSIKYDLFKLRLDGHKSIGTAKDYIINHPSVVKGGRADKYKRYEYSFNKWKECFKVDANFTDINSKSSLTTLTRTTLGEQLHSI